MPSIFHDKKEKCFNYKNERKDDTKNAKFKEQNLLSLNSYDKLIIFDKTSILHTNHSSFGVFPGYSTAYTGQNRVGMIGAQRSQRNRIVHMFQNSIGTSTWNFGQNHVFAFNCSRRIISKSYKEIVWKQNSD